MSGRHAEQLFKARAAAAWTFEAFVRAADKQLESLLTALTRIFIEGHWNSSTNGYAVSDRRRSRQDGVPPGNKSSRDGKNDRGAVPAMACTDKIASRRPIIATFWGGLSLILSCAAIVPKIHAQPPAPITPEAVLKSMERGVAWLKQEQQADGNWPDRPGYAQGLTPLCTLALLHAGCDAKDPAVAKALTVLRGLEPQATYTTSLQTMVFCLADPKEFHDLIVRNVKWLESRQHKFGPRTGMWATSDPGSPDHTDNSMTHLAMLALYEEIGRAHV